jgi:3-deoxy-D-manno-octulosonic-acid transferase
MMLILDLLYIIFLLLCFPLWIKVLFKEEYRKILKHRLSPAITPGNQKRIWIHAVSVGEVRSLKHLIERLKQTYNKTEIVLTVTTPMGFRTTAELYTDIRVIHAPVDFSFTIKRFIKQINPALLILNELEIWPNWVSITHKKNIPILVINGRISNRAFGRYKKFKFLAKHFFKKIDYFLVQAELYKERFRDLDVPGEKIIVCGNIKADEAFNTRQRLPQDREILGHLGINADNKKIVTIASSHQDDEELTIPIFNQVGDNFLFILVPRHLNRLEEIERRLTDQRVDFSTWSKRDKNPSGNKKKVLIFDEMGYLFNVLKITDMVFMGGTLNPKIGGHNLYEPAVLGKLILGGPHYNNFPDVGSELVKRGVYRVVRTPGECLQHLLDWENIAWDSIKTQAEQAVTARRGSIQCTLEMIRQFMTLH